MWVKCNPNPVGRQTGDCVIRAIAVVTGQSWREAYWDLCEQGAVMGDLPNNNAVWGEYLRERGGRQFLLPESCPSCITVRAFCERYPEGTYVIGSGDHAIHTQVLVLQGIIVCHIVPLLLDLPRDLIQGRNRLGRGITAFVTGCGGADGGALGGALGGAVAAIATGDTA